jgi:hypothetical protein
MQPRTCILTAVILTSAMGFGAAAQTSDQDARRAGESVVQAHNKASQAKDAAGVAALYTADASRSRQTALSSVVRRSKNSSLTVSRCLPQRPPSSIRS